MVDLTEAAHRQIRTYSKGMRQRAKLAGALVHEPRILLLDEPFNGMDPRQRLHMMALLRSMAAAGRVILFSSHILEEVERLAEAVLVVYAGRLAASGDFRSIRRLMTDRPHRFTIRSSDDRRLASALLGQPAVFGAELVDGLLAVHTSDFAAFTRALAGVARERGSASSRSRRRTIRWRVSSAIWCGGEGARSLVRVTLQSLLGRRRILLMLLLGALPVLVGLAIRLGGGRADAPAILDTLVIRTVLPLVALVIGSAALGSEIEDGTVVYLLVKPVPRWVVALAKIAVAVGLTLVLTIPPMLVTGPAHRHGDGGSLGPSLAFVVAAIAGGAAYASVFTTLGALTTRALVVGLGYTLLWEGVLAGLLEGTRFLSIRQATLGIAAAFGGGIPIAQRWNRRSRSSSWSSPSRAHSCSRPWRCSGSRSAPATDRPRPPTATRGVPRGRIGTPRRDPLGPHSRIGRHGCIWNITCSVRRSGARDSDEYLPPGLTSEHERFRSAVDQAVLDSSCAARNDVMFQERRALDGQPPSR